MTTHTTRRVSNGPGLAVPSPQLREVDASGQRVFIPESELLEIHGECLRLAHPHAELDEAGFASQPSS
jgi:hypothetical protein